MHGEARQHYREMLEEGYDPNRGLAPVYGAIIVSGLVASVVCLAAFAGALGAATSLVNSIFSKL